MMPKILNNIYNNIEVERFYQEILFFICSGDIDSISHTGV